MQIQNLRKQVLELERASASSSSPTNEKDLYEETNKKFLIEELKSRVSTQNELIVRLKEHVANYRRMEEEYLRLKKENKEAFGMIQGLKEKLEVAQALNRPVSGKNNIFPNVPLAIILFYCYLQDNEILALLAQKFDELNTRYLQREQQMETLLNRLSIRTGAGPVLGGIRSGFDIAKPPLLGSSSSSSSSELGLGLDLRQLSPSLSMHLFNTGNNPGQDFPEV